MRNLRLIGCCLVSVVLAGASRAQPRPIATTAATVLANVQHYYANANQLTADFRQIVTNATFNTTKISDGTLWVAKPARFRWDYYKQDRRRQVSLTKNFVFDGQTLWMVDHDNKQIVQSQVHNSALPAAVSFLIGGGNLASQFNTALDTTGRFAAKDSVVLELTPKQPSAQYTKLFFVVDPSNWRVKESIVIDANGNTNTFKFFRPDLTAPIKPQLFQVKPSTLPSYALVVAGAQGTSGSAQPPPTRPRP
jgi:outer membrane lipoprotein carrier protein